MKKSLVFGVAGLIVLVGLGVFVSAYGEIYNSPPTNSGMYDYSYSVDLENGWNLIAYEESFPDTMAKAYVGEDQALYQKVYDYLQISGLERKDKDSPLFVYTLNPKTGEYVELFPKNQLTDSIREDLRSGAMWVYSKDSYNIKYLSFSVPPLSDRELISGWNFVAITPEMEEQTINNVKGNCDIQSLYFFDNEHQKWITYPSTEEINSAMIGLGAIVKVSSSCSLGTSSNAVTSPPSLPSTPSISCTDSDGGLNYNVKGIASKEDAGTTEDFCVSSVKLSEALCNNDGNPAYAQYDCPNGCSNGACL